MGEVIQLHQSVFTVGQLVEHRLFGYRGVVVGVDMKFRLTDEWYNQVAQSRPPKNKPWYHVLVDGATHRTYVAERNLMAASTDEPVDHPLIGYYFTAFTDGHYTAKKKP